MCGIAEWRELLPDENPSAIDRSGNEEVYIADEHDGGVPPGSAVRAGSASARKQPQRPTRLPPLCCAALEDFMVPKYADIVPCLPKSENGKIDRKQAGSPCAT